VVDEAEPRKTFAPHLVRSMGLGNRVRFTGKLPLQQLVRRYRTSGVLVMPSLFEGFGLPAAEAMACATPVIATRAGSLPEVVGEDQEGGKLVPAADPGALAEAILALHTQPRLTADLSQRARHRAERFFSWKQTARNTADVYSLVRDQGVQRTEAVSA
jgi:glycosyltransferase involved in cell wall biosynthesis